MYRVKQNKHAFEWQNPLKIVESMKTVQSQMMYELVYRIPTWIFPALNYRDGDD
jgi:hypothetical protein